MDQEEFMVRQIWSTHEPDGRWLDTELLVHVVKDIMLFTDQESQVSLTTHHLQTVFS